MPIASVAKLMAAYAILQDHPMPVDGSGPDIKDTEPEPGDEEGGDSEQAS